MVHHQLRYAMLYTAVDLDKTVRTVDGEARGEVQEGQAAVAWVVRNRATWDEVLDPGHPEHEWWGVSPATVCTHPWQFSCWNGGPDTDHITSLLEDSQEYQAISVIVDSVFTGTTPDPTRGATTYKVAGTKASWDNAVAGVPPKQIGHHLFWRLSPHGTVLPLLDEQV